MVNDSISKSWNKNLSHHWIRDVDEFVVVGGVSSRYDFMMKPDTVILIMLFKLESLGSLSLATATVKVCLKYI